MQLEDALKGMVEPDTGDDLPAPATRPLWSGVRVAMAIAAVTVMLVTLFPSQHVSIQGARMVAASVAPPLSALRPDEPPSEPKRSAADIQVDSDGRVTEVSGPDPRIVLSALCAHEQFAPNLSPIGLAPAVPPSPGARLGLVRDSSDPSETRSVQIRRNPDNGRWVVGDGVHPIQTQAVPSFSSEVPITSM
jgi:hypothetical protein